MLLTTHQQLLDNVWKKVTCEIQWIKITDARIQTEDEYIFICNNERDWADCKDKLWYKYSLLVSTNYCKYNEAVNDVKNIQLVEEYKPWDIISTEWIIPFEDKTCKELWLKEWDLVVILENVRYFKQWEIVKLKKDDNSCIPQYTNWIKSSYLLNTYVWPIPRNSKTVKVKPDINTYQKIFRRDDWLEFTEGKIGEETIQQIKDRRKKLISDANKITALLRQHSKLF